jgi:hypothetical protein
MLCSDFFSFLSFSRYKLLEWIWRHGLFYTMRLSELEAFAMFWDLKNYSVIETDNLWYDLREYMCYFLCSACVFSPLLPWLCLTCIMNYPLCMTHGLATAYYHDHAWTENELRKFVNWACQCPLCACSSILENIVRAVASTGFMVRAKIIHLNMPCWMWVLWPSWGGRIVLS